MIERKKYLERLIARKENGLVKVITGIRRCGKSYLLFNIYKSYLKSIGVEDEQIICLALDDDENIQYRNPLELGKYIRSMTTDESKTYYVFLDEIQKVVTIQNPYIQGAEDKIGFVDVVLGLMKHDNIDVYVTGSNSKMLSSDILTEFRGRGDEIRVNPLSFEEFYHAYEGDKRDAWQEYYTYGGLPLVMMKKSHEEKAKYLQSLFDKIYLGDIIERNKILHDKSVLDDILNIISSSVGSLTNAGKIAKTFRSERQVNISDETVSRYLEFFVDAFMIYKADRYDVKGRKYIGSPLKYYFSDVGLRNARLNFRQQEENHMFSGEEPVAAKKKATKIVKKLNANNKSHSRHFTVDFCKELGLNITELESDQTLQELVLSVHHAFIITIDATAATKLIENQNGARYITSQKK